MSFNYLINFYNCKNWTILNCKIRSLETMTFWTISYSWKSRCIVYLYLPLKYVPWVLEHPLYVRLYACIYIFAYIYNYTTYRSVMNKNINNMSQIGLGDVVH